MKYLLSILIIAVLASMATMWHSLATIRDAIQQTNAIILAACGSDERPCQVAAHRVSTGFSNFRFEGPMPSFQFRENQL
jgi:hypothetical protein